MKSDSWFFIILRSTQRIRTVRVGNRIFAVGGVLAILFLGAVAFFTYGYFSLRAEKGRWLHEREQLQNQIASFEQEKKKHYLNTLPPKPSSPPVGIQEMKIIRRAKGRGVSVSFRLVNQFARDFPVLGTIFMVAKNEAVNPPVYRVIPEGELLKGIPQHPEKGKDFEVRKDKFVEAYFDGAAGEPFKKMTVYVYGQNGKLILEQTLDIPEKASGD